MRAVWSYWTRPYRARTGWGFRSEIEHLASWALSVWTAACHFSETLLVTDRAGADLLVDGLGLRFSAVRVELDSLAAPLGLWNAGKLQAARVAAGMGDPFVHVDADLFLWKPLPDRILRAPLLGESLYRTSDFVSVDQCGRAIEAAGGALPAAWGRADQSVACGVFGGADLDTIGEWLAAAGPLYAEPAAAALAAATPSAPMIPEEYLFRQTALARGVPIETVFKSERAKWRGGAARRLGYTHLIGDGKYRYGGAVCARLEHDAPALFARAQGLADRPKEMAAA
jgi:hypothetical protein